jgi:myo-inositol 2-dehydrogenase / D-chiro-inositol 1-dehydrogenase
LTKERNRRDFLRTAAGATAAGTVLPYWFSGRMARAEQSKNDKVSVAAIGVGGRAMTLVGAEMHGLAVEMKGLVDVVACADVDLSNANRYVDVTGLRGKCDICQDHRKVLDRKDVDAVIIATPDHWHVKLSIDAMNAGKDVYCEKPLTLTIEQGKQICEATERTGRIVQVGTQQRSGSCFLEAVALARSGRLGDNLMATVSVGSVATAGPFQNSEPPASLDWDRWLGPAPKAPFCPQRIGLGARHWFDYSGGHVTDWGVHHVDIALWALGGEDTGPIEVEGRGEFPLGTEIVREYLLGRRSVDQLPNHYNTATEFDCVLRLPNGRTLNFNSNPNDVHLRGDRGHLSVNRGGIRGRFVEEFKSDPANREWLAAEVAKLLRGIPWEGHLDFQRHMAGFIHCIKTRAKPISDVWTHCNTMNACHMANIAMLLQRKIKWDPQKREFVGDSEANRLRHRPQREPYAIRG